MSDFKQNLPSITVLMATYNGEKYIKEQIESILRQTNVSINLLIRDDGSTDSTVTIIKEYVNNYSNIKMLSGYNVGVAMNFIELLHHSEESEFYAFADQDDIWDENKLSTGISLLRKENYQGPELYCCKVRDVDASGVEFGKVDNRIKIADTLGKAMIFSNAQGSTMVFNNQLKQLIIKATPDFKKLGILHDAWIHKVCLAVGGKVIIDLESHMGYRVHGENVMARTPVNRSLLKKLIQLFQVEKEYYCSNIAKAIIDLYSDEIPEHNMEILSMTAYYRNNIFYRMKLLFSKRVKTDNIKFNINFMYRVIIGKA